MLKTAADKDFSLLLTEVFRDVLIRIRISGNGACKSCSCQGFATDVLHHQAKCRVLVPTSKVPHRQIIGGTRYSFFYHVPSAAAKSANHHRHSSSFWFGELGASRWTTVYIHEFELGNVEIGKLVVLDTTRHWL